MGYSDPLSLVLAGDARDSMNYGMIATGNHFNFDSLRGAPPLISKGSLWRTDCHTSAAALVRNDSCSNVLYSTSHWP